VFGTTPILRTILAGVHCLMESCRFPNYTGIAYTMRCTSDSTGSTTQLSPPPRGSAVGAQPDRWSGEHRPKKIPRAEGRTWTRHKALRALGRTCC
jgi:hypothetical protein